MTDTPEKRELAYQRALDSYEDAKKSEQPKQYSIVKLGKKPVYKNVYIEVKKHGIQEP